ncbi:hypothetical protein BDV96DRAFT_654171 [Lophiotrema nucula]|uniref:Uncharacterized protein n=1 Tax=Lophiotrema nucula TaxID=690887 RepID=A0A6A5YJC9_9PLEO|nr:hypothetical protein BDV96DRAFT_654171 [Lophiotrema nucula]
MHVSILLRGLTLGAGAVLAAPTNSANTSVSEKLAAQFGIWQECLMGDHTDCAVEDERCYMWNWPLPGKYMTIWWLANGCEINVFSGMACHGDSAKLGILNQCWGIDTRMSFQVYC